jgi:L-threonylcarbamoyladenylate synthase
MSMIEQIQRAVELLKLGDVVGLPTETVYGLAADALNPAAVAKIFAVKGRPEFDPLIVHVTGIEEAQSLTKEFPLVAQKLAQVFWPGPLTLVLPKNEKIPDIVTAGLDSVAIRAPSHPVMRSVLERLGRPIAAPSANRFGRISPTCAQAVLDELGSALPLVIDAGPSDIGVESTVISLLEEKPALLRAGGLPLEEIEKIIGPVRVETQTPDKPTAPGQLKSHYAPEKKLKLVCSWNELEKIDCSKAGLLAFGELPPQAFARVAQLSREGDMETAAANLFAHLRLLDSSEVEWIAAKLLPEHGLGRAINDRLRRAAA